MCYLSVFSEFLFRHQWPCIIVCMYFCVYDEKRHAGILPAPAIYGIQNKPKPHSAVSQMQLKTPLSNAK